MSATPLLKFTPSAMSTEVLEAITVQREPLIASLVEAALDVEGGRRHHLLVGPRGMGKSHVLTIAAERIRAAADDSLVIATLVEDPWATRTYAKFLASILAALDHPQAAAMRSRGSDDETERLLREAIGDRRLVLTVENLDEIFRRIGADGQSRLRALAENWSGLLILASTPQLFSGVSRHTSPFYGFFRITHLDELTPDNAGELLRRIAHVRGDDELAAFLVTDVGRRRLLAVNALAGGHPRIWLLFAGCISIAAIDELVPLFLEALDDLTPYYQDRLRELGDQQQELVILLCETGGALSNRELAERSGLPQNQVGAALGKLEDRGYVRRATLPESLNTGDARASYWELREPLMRLSLDVKQSRGRPLQLVVEFLRVWYGARILDEMKRLPRTALLAMAYSVEVVRTLDEALGPEHLLEGPPDEAIARAERGLAISPDSAYLRLARGRGLLGAGRVRESIEAIENARDLFANPLFRAAIDLAANELRESIGDPIIQQRAGAALSAFDRASAEDGINHELRGMALEQIGRDDEALAAYDLATTCEPGNAQYHLVRARLLHRLGRVEDALHAVEPVRNLRSHDSSTHAACALVLKDVGLLADAENAIAEALRLDSEDFYRHLIGAEIAAARTQRDLATTRLLDALERRRASRDISFRDAHRIVDTLWRIGGPVAAIVATLGSFEIQDDLYALGQALVTTIPGLTQSVCAADDWVEKWQRACGELDELTVPLQMVAAAIAFARTGDRKALLALPPEQREIVVGLLEGS